MVKISVLFFAILKEKTGVSRIEIEVPEELTVADLKIILAERFPAIKSFLRSVITSVNREFAFDEDRIPGGAEVAFFPPVSGGSDFPTIIAVTEKPFDLEEILQQITLNASGAACLFTGIVRGLTQRGEAHETSSLEYEAYIPMAESKMAQIAQEMRQNWPDIQGIAIIQRIGHLDVGIPSVLVACSSAHRDDGIFDAARYGIDRLKEIVPVWKKEIGLHNEVWIDGDYRPKRGD
ncbi:MAG: molybdopterin converting factor subunit 1 [Planctomycetes bacterium]|nr:molybdopterin converting factor subunit 1 [Planctomycetota bacterium]